MRIAVIGTGIIGCEVVMALRRAKYDVIIFNRTPAKAAALEIAGAMRADNIRSAVEKAEVIFLTLADKKAIDDTLWGIKMTLSHKTFIQMGTIAPQESVALAARIAEAGGDYLECPILGSRREIEENRVILLVGGSRNLFDRWRELLMELGPDPRYIGEIGKAAALKLALNQLIAVHAAGFSLSLGIVERNNIDRQQFMEILRESSLYASMYDKKLCNWIARDFSNPNFPTKHLQKDVRLIADHAAVVGLNTGVVEAIEAIIDQSIEGGCGDMDYSSIINVIHPRTE